MALQAVNVVDTLNGAGAGQILLMLLSLQVDPACNLLGIDLEVNLYSVHDTSLI